MKKTSTKLNLIRIFFSGMLFVTFASWSTAQLPTIETPDGYAGYYGTTGGDTVSSVTVTTPEEFLTAVKGDDPAVIVVDGLLDVGNVSIGSNKTIAGSSTTSGLYGGKIKLSGSNYILQNLILGPNPEGTVLKVTGADKVFIHKCDFLDGAKGNLKIVKGADNVTVSWCKFYFTDTTFKGNALVIGCKNDTVSDEDNLHVTLHHNWFAEGCISAMPKVRYGQVHIFNNYYNCEGNTYCIGTGYNCHIRCQNLYFENVNSPWADYSDSSSGGEIGWDDLKFVYSSQPTYTSNAYPVFLVPYSIGVNKVENVRNIVSISAGNTFEESVCIPAIVSLTSPTNNQIYADPTTITLSADASDPDGKVRRVEFFKDTISIGVDTRTPYTLDWEIEEKGTFRLTAEATDNHSNITVSEPVYITVGYYPCDSVITVSAPFSFEGAGEYCWRTSDSNLFINSWSVEELKINGQDLENDWITKLPNKLDGYYYIHYIGQYDWSHFEIMPNINGESIKSVTTEEISDNDFICYPNPTNNTLNISINQEMSEPANLYLLDATGRIVTIEKVSGLTHTLNISTLPSGVYLIRISGTHCNMEHRIIKQ